MPALTGVFDQFKNLEKIPAENIQKNIKPKVGLRDIENYLGNRILYPQTIAVNALEMEIDLSILREAVRQNSQRFYSLVSKKVIIPEIFLPRFTPLYKLVSCFADGLKLEGIVEVYIQADKDRKLIGSIITYQPNPGKTTVPIIVNGKQFTGKANTLSLFPFTDQHLNISIDNSPIRVIAGGNLGVLIDLRKK